MPEMLEYFGRTFTVSSRVERACDAVSRVRYMPDAVMLEDLRCDGSSHGGCQAGCKLYWKEHWLRRVTPGEPVGFETDPALAPLRELAVRRAQPSTSSQGETRYSCQATDFVSATELIPYWSFRSFAREVTSRNISLWTFLRVAARIIVDEPRRRWGGQHPFSRPGSLPPAVPSRAYAPGARVRVRRAEEIAETLDTAGKLRGLWFDREMTPYCGKAATVKAKVQRFINEHTGEMVELKTDCYILDGVVCKGQISDGRWFCCREIYPWWREAWLEPEPNSAAQSKSAAPSDSS